MPQAEDSSGYLPQSLPEGGFLMEFTIPSPLKAEHEELHAVLGAAARERGELGAAGSAVAELMHPHFIKEEEYALPPLGLLFEQSRGNVTPEMKDVLVLTDKLKAGLDQMLKEHRLIVAALESLAAIAAGAGRTEYVEFTEVLKLHA